MNPQFSRYYTYIRPILRNKSLRNYSPIAFSIFTIVIFSVFAIRPTVGTIIGLQKSIKEQAEALNQLQAKSDGLTAGKRNYQNIDPKIRAKIDSLLPDKTDLPVLIAQLSSLTNDLEASISGLQFQPVDLTGAPSQIGKDINLQEISFTYNIQGGYPQLNELLKRISQSTRLISIQSINIGHAGDVGLIMSVNAKSYYIKGS